jgi:hypothetical protein
VWVRVKVRSGRIYFSCVAKDLMLRSVKIYSYLDSPIEKFQFVLRLLFLTLDVNTTHLNRPPPF